MMDEAEDVSSEEEMSSEEADEESDVWLELMPGMSHDEMSISERANKDHSL